MKRKPMTLESIMPAAVAPPVPDSAAPAAQAKTAAGQGGGKRAAVKQQTLYLPHAVWKQLRELAFHEEVSMHSLVVEGLDLMFAARGARPIKELTGEG